MCRSGSSPHRVLSGPANDEEPRFSPDGSAIVFTSKRHGRFQLYVMNADGTGVRRLVASAADDAEPYWSPDGKLIVFSRVTAKTASIWVVDADGRGQQKITDVCLSADCVDGMAPVAPAWQALAS